MDLFIVLLRYGPTDNWLLRGDAAYPTRDMAEGCAVALRFSNPTWEYKVFGVVDLSPTCNLSAVAP